MLSLQSSWKFSTEDISKKELTVDKVQTSSSSLINADEGDKFTHVISSENIKKLD